MEILGTDFVDAAILNLVGALNTRIAQIDAKLANNLIEPSLVSYYNAARLDMGKKRDLLAAMLTDNVVISLVIN